MTINNFLKDFEQNFNLSDAADWDNVGLICGDDSREISNILICHDAIESVVEEAVKNNANLIICFHPIIFGGLKKINAKNYVERAIMKALENKIAIYALHTAWDFNQYGVNFGIAQKLGLKNLKFITEKQKDLLHLEVYVPKEFAETLKIALYNVGAGNIGNYDQCSFQIDGIGQFRASENATPFIGKANLLEKVEETLIKVIFEKHKKTAILNALKKAHPYEEIAHQILQLENNNQYVGSGCIGELEKEIDELAFLKLLKSTFGIPILKHSKLNNKKIKKIALLGGSGSSELQNTINQNCDAFITGDLKYHDFFSAQNNILLVDIGHFESEQWVVEQLFDIISKKITKFAILKTKIKTNPVNYF